MWMKLVKNELFIEKKKGQNSCWIEIQVKYDNWIIIQLLGFNFGSWITSKFNLDHKMHMKLTVGARTKFGSSDQRGEVGSCQIRGPGKQMKAPNSNQIQTVRSMWGSQELLDQRTKQVDEGIDFLKKSMIQTEILLINCNG